MSIEGKWAGEEALLAAANYLNRDIHVYKYVSVPEASPDVYHATFATKHPPIAVAFYEPGHYQAVFSKPVNCSQTSPARSQPAQYRADHLNV